MRQSVFAYADIGPAPMLRRMETIARTMRGWPVFMITQPMAIAIAVLVLIAMLAIAFMVY